MSVKQPHRRASRPLAQRIGAGGPSRVRRGPSSGRQASGWPDAAGLDQQQTQLLAVLRRARGETVSYDELRDAGVEYPASVVAELELSGFPLERSFGGAAGRKLGVRLDQRATTAIDRPDESDEAKPALSRPRVAGAWTGVGMASAAATHARRASPAGASYVARTAARARAVAKPLRSLRGNARWLAPAVLVLVTGILVALIAAGTGTTGRVTTEYRGGAPPSRGPLSPHTPGSTVAPRTRASSAPQPEASTNTHTPQAPPPQAHPSPATPRAPVSGASAAELEARGHALLAAGELRAAIPTLRQALAATGKGLATCLAPVTEACLTYAYALYDLGRALRLAREPAAAVPILEQRLRIANQRTTVRGELERAREEAGQRPTTASTSP